MPAPIYLDLSHTSHSRARTGIQRVTLSLRAALAGDAVAVTHDPYRGGWRRLERWEESNLHSAPKPGKRGAVWPLKARLRSRVTRLLGRSAESPALPADSAAGVIVPEVFSPAVAMALPALFATTRGPRVALFHDAIPLKLPELSAPRTVARFPVYLQELLAFDGIAAVSDDSRDSLLDYWRWLEVTSTPPVQTISLGLDLVAQLSPVPNPPASRPTVLSVGSIEGRKNHVALLDACEQLWAAGHDFDLRLIGMAQSQTGGAALAQIRRLQGKGRRLRYEGPASDAQLEAAYAECAFTVYPSLLEGFGLPVLESLARGKPCVCSGRGAVGESARGGGCVSLQRMGADELAAAIRRLLATPAELAGLVAAARARQFRSWTDYARDLTGWMRGLKSR